MSHYMHITRLRNLVFVALPLWVVISTPQVSFSDQNDTQERSSQAKIHSGQESEKRFPAIQVPDGFKATLFACDPLVEYPSVIAPGPQVGMLFVAHDYLTGLGVEIVRRDEIRLIQDTDGDLYADKSILFAAGFNSIQGLAYDGEAVYVMHAPLLSSLRDIDGDGVADKRHTLLRGLGLPPEENDNRLHCANGVVVGHDGWLYLALGDRGCDVRRPEGDRLLFQQGGILRCRPDGSDLHVFATGLRNIYDIALDEELNVFVRDNENDGGDYLIRVCHCFFGSDHGYPYRYRERPAEAMPPLMELGRGSSAGGICYLESAYPSEFCGSLFFCEWGRSVVRYSRERSAGSFATVPETDFAFGDAKDPYGFKPTDLVVDRDGSLIVSDWADGQRPKRGRARIYRISYGEQASQPLMSANDSETSLSAWIAQLNSRSYNARVEAQRAIERRGERARESLLNTFTRGDVRPIGRLHAIWALTHVMRQQAVEPLFQIASSDKDPRVRAQSIRALADLSDPVLIQHRLGAGQGDPDVARRLANLAVDADPRILLEVVIALGRLRWQPAPKWLRKHFRGIHDPAIAHAVMQTLRHANNWNDVAAIADDANPFLRDAAMKAMAEQTVPELVDELCARLNGHLPVRRQEYADLLTRVYKKPGPWKYWGFRPAPRPANTERWERTDAIEQALDRLLNASTPQVRAFVAKRMIREKIPLRLSTVDRWINEEKDPRNVALILAALDSRAPDETRSIATRIIQSANYSESNRLTALAMFIEGLGARHDAMLRDLAQSVEDGPIMAKLLLQLGRRSNVDCDSILLAKLNSSHAEVRTAAIDALAMRNNRQATSPIVQRLHDENIQVRRAAATAVGRLGARESIPRLRELAQDGDRTLCRACIESLTMLKDPQSVALVLPALRRRETQLSALAYLEQFGSPDHIPQVINVAHQIRAFDVQATVIRTLNNWMVRYPKRKDELRMAIARVQGKSGTPIRWTMFGPLTSQRAEEVVETLVGRPSTDPLTSTIPSFTTLAEGVDARVGLPDLDTAIPNDTWLAVTQVFVDDSCNVEMLASSNGTLLVTLNGRSVFRRDEPSDYRADSDRFQAELAAGVNQLTVNVSGALQPRFHLRFRPTSSHRDHERLTQLALAKNGNVDRGREVFFSAEKSQCIKCHQLDCKGGRVGPDLANVGRRFSRVHLIESLLDPSRTIAPSYETIQVLQKDGRIVSGVRLMEDQDSLTLGDAQGTTFRIRKETIEETHEQRRSTMPDGLEKILSDTEFLDLISFLVSISD